MAAPTAASTVPVLGYTGGEISERDSVESQRGNLSFGAGKGVFMEILSEMLAGEGLTIPFTAIDEEASHT